VTVAGPTIVLCVVTYRRPDGLKRLLGRLALLETGDATVEVVIVDNDEQGSAGEIVESSGLRSRFDVTVEVEPQRGISYARNRALALALARQPDWIGWIDDDEAPRPDWLVRLLDTQRRTDADVLLGPSAPIYEPGGSALAIATGAFEAPTFRTGQAIPFFLARTSGVIVRARAVPREGFDESLSLTGGEDRLHFTLIERRGGKFVWDADAVVDEWVPASRQTPAWLLRRWFRVGVTRSLVLLLLDDPSLLRRLRRVAGGSLMALRGLGLALMAAPRGADRALAALEVTMVGIGAAVGAFGVHYREYRTVHGR
jgi:glycosyltransferase involved in cell wall biosynthesis